MTETSDVAPLDLVAQATRALTLYSLAEFQSGHATEIHVEAEGRSFSVSDNGRGHSLSKLVAGSPYLQFVYTHLEYPFEGNVGGPVQLQGIGIALLNSLCSELAVTVRKVAGGVCITYRDGLHCSQQEVGPQLSASGNTVAGSIRAALQTSATDRLAIKHWLLAVQACNPRLQVSFNGEPLNAPPKSAA